jgi:uncharacterized protein related to proFAR isomerase
MLKLSNSQVAVLDWLDGDLVQARGGDRANYRPLSEAFPTWKGRSPRDLVGDLHRLLGVDHFYLADLDALQGRPDSGGCELAVFLLEQGLTLWWDRGFAAGRAGGFSLRELTDRYGPRLHPVLGTESCGSPQELFRRLGAPDRPNWTLSLDLLRRGESWQWFGHDSNEPASNREAEDSWQSCDCLEIVGQAVKFGLTELIVLNLEDVGAHSTSTGPLLQAIRQAWPNICLLAGGGVRAAADVQKLQNLGADGVLVGTWLWTRLSQHLP